MPTFAESLSEKLDAALALAAGDGELPADFSAQVDPAQNPQFGDYQSNAAMVLAKRLGRNPRELAAEVAEKFDGGGLCPEPEIAGPGFINFRIRPEALTEQVLAMLGDEERVGVSPIAEPQRIVVDFSAPNVAKPMHVGHIRSTIIGDCLARVARFLGHDVVSDNHIGDWGTQFGMILWGWKNLLDESALESDPVAELLRLYREVNARCKESDELRQECKAELVALQAGDAGNLAIWERCVEFSKRGLQSIYNRLGVEFDLWLGESHYNDQLAPLVEKLLAEGIAEESEGAVCVFSDGGLPPKEDPFLKQEDGEWKPQPALIRKSDGGYLYATTDLATIDHRVGELGADAVWYVVGAPQQLHFDQIFRIAKRCGQEVDLQFIPFGSILGKDRKMLRTRSGETVQLADVLEEAVTRARAIVEEKNADLPEEEKAAIAEAIGIGSVKYAELSQFRMTDYIFDWDTMLSLKGNTAPYLLNAYVRTRAIFRKLGEDFSGLDEAFLAEEAEQRLALKLARFAEAVPAVLEDFRPNALAAYLYELATTYHKFWEACPVLRETGTVRDTRLALCELTGRVLHTGLGLLGIRTTEVM